MYSREEAIEFLDEMAHEWECSREQWESAIVFLDSMSDSFQCKLLVGNDAAIEITWDYQESRHTAYFNEEGFCSLYQSDTQEFLEGLTVGDLIKAVKDN